MKPLDLNARLVDSYMDLLRNLGRPAKLALIDKLSKSVKKNLKPEHSFDKAFGAWSKSDKAETLTQSIRTSRNFSHRITTLSEKPIISLRSNLYYSDYL